jgi:hypothetical protein
VLEGSRQALVRSPVAFKAGWPRSSTARLRAPGPGGIILMHEAGGMHALWKRGYRFVTISWLILDEPPRQPRGRPRTSRPVERFGRAGCQAFRSAGGFPPKLSPQAGATELLDRSSDMACSGATSASRR